MKKASALSPADYLIKILNARVYDVATESALETAKNLSQRIHNTVLLKREDQQQVRSFKLRGAYNKMAHLSAEQLKKGVICASAGNHAQGVALAASRLQARAVIVMPTTTPQVKVDAVRGFGGEVVLHGDSYTDAHHHALTLEKKQGMTFVHPFDDPDVIAGQGTIAMEILRQHQGPVDAVFVAIGGGHCSALVRLLPGAADVVFAHATWAGFEDMTRVLKDYRFPWSTTGSPGAPPAPATRVVFSSDPGSLFSGDDFYVMDSGLAMLETTIGNNNATLYALFVTPRSVLEWVRNVVANRLAATGAEWAALFARHNSGTYNNENLVADFKLFAPGAPPKPGFLWAADQIPGSVEAHDITGELVAEGYVASVRLAFGT